MAAHNLLKTSHLHWIMHTYGEHKLMQERTQTHKDNTEISRLEEEEEEKKKGC